jgi:hypothetical protein
VDFKSLIIIAIDVKDQLFPVAYAMIDAENDNN